MDASKVVETERELIRRATEAASDVAWIVGECAAKWTARYAKGQTDADFARLIGESDDTVQRRRLTWETFADVKDKYGNLKWSHFYVAITWDDSAECLSWADDHDATVAEMKAWRRMQHGDDLTVDADKDELLSDSKQFESPNSPDYKRPSSAPVRKLENAHLQSDHIQPAPSTPSQPSARDVTVPETMATLEAATAPKPYAPFLSDAKGKKPTDSKPSSATQPPADSPAQSPRFEAAHLVEYVENRLPRVNDIETLLIALGDVCIDRDRAAAQSAIETLVGRFQIG